METVIDKFAEHGPVWMLVAVLIVILVMGSKMVFNKLISSINNNTEAFTQLSGTIEHQDKTLTRLEKTVLTKIEHESELTRTLIKKEYN